MSTFDEHELRMQLLQTKRELRGALDQVSNLRVQLRRAQRDSERRGAHLAQLLDPRLRQAALRRVAADCGALALAAAAQHRRHENIENELLQRLAADRRLADNLRQIQLARARNRAESRDATTQANCALLELVTDTHQMVAELLRRNRKRRQRRGPRVLVRRLRRLTLASSRSAMRHLLPSHSTIPHAVQQQLDEVLLTSQYHEDQEVEVHEEEEVHEEQEQDELQDELDEDYSDHFDDDHDVKTEYV